MVWVTVPTPSVLSEWVQARERDPSRELALVKEAVLERASRVILAEGTGGKGTGALQFVKHTKKERKETKLHDKLMLGRYGEFMLVWRTEQYPLLQSNSS